MTVREQFLLHERMQAILDDIRYGIGTCDASEEHALLTTLQCEVSHIASYLQGAMSGKAQKLAPEILMNLSNHIELAMHLKDARPSTNATLIELKSLVSKIENSN